MGDMFLPLKRFFDFSGRSRRREYWLFILLYSIVATIAVVLDIQFGLGGDYTSYSDFGEGSMSMGFHFNFGPLTIAVMLLFLIPLLSVSVRRMHDVGKSGWFMLIPLYNFILTCVDGNRGPNQYGPDPKEGPPSQIFS
jgi:uncharacterized membrane protein YhaH (DUF805 family)